MSYRLDRTVTTVAAGDRRLQTGSHSMQPTPTHTGPTPPPPTEAAPVAAVVDGDDFQFDGYPNEVRVATKYVDPLTDDELQELNRLLRWHCFTVDSRGRRFGRRARQGKRDVPQEIPDRRLKVLHDSFGLAGKHVLEVGCFEGVHTVGLCRLAGRVTAIDSRVENVVKTIVRCALFDARPTVFKCDLDLPVDVAGLPQVDIVHHVGVFYHVVDPIAHILDLAAKVTDGMMIDTHVARPGEDTMSYTTRGRTYTYRHFREGGKAEVFAGMGDHAKWLSIDTLFGVLHDAGFTNTKLLEEREERNGRRILAIARRPSPTPGPPATKPLVTTDTASPGSPAIAKSPPAAHAATSNPRDTISDDYLRLQMELHRNPEYGVAALGFGQVVKDLFLKIQGKTIADYGAGKCKLREALINAGLEGFEYFPFDPAFPEYGEPRPADLVCCLDVLEHVEEPYVDRIVAQLRSITVNHGLFSIATGPAKKTLADGRNAHLIQKPSSWWLPKFLPHFEILRLVTGENGFWFVVRPADHQNS